MIVIAFPFTILIAGMLFSFLDWLRYSLSDWFDWEADSMGGFRFIFRVFADFLESDVILLFNISLVVVFWFIMVCAIMVLTGEGI